MRFVPQLEPIFHGASWVVERAYAHWPFATMIELRRGIQDKFFGAPREEQPGLMRAYPRLSQLTHPDDRAAEKGMTSTSS